MIRPGFTQRRSHCLKSQRGGIALLVVLGFMALSVPLVSSALGLAATASIDSRSKKQILRRQYCALGAGEWVKKYFLSRVATVYGGTQDIQRNIIAERIFGLPRG